jgi:hypothetical protein
VVVHGNASKIAIAAPSRSYTWISHDDAWRSLHMIRYAQCQKRQFDCPPTADKSQIRAVIMSAVQLAYHARSEMQEPAKSEPPASILSRRAIQYVFPIWALERVAVLFVGRFPHLEDKPQA